jgi:hypothetical protein
MIALIERAEPVPGDRRSPKFPYPEASSLGPSLDFDHELRRHF